jgi:hypothetical protein
MLSKAQLAEQAGDDPWPFLRELDLKDRKLVSVTTILRRAGMVRFHIPREHLAQLAQVGKDVHLVCEDIARRTVSDYWSGIQSIAPYARGFLKFMADFDFKVELIEERLEHPFLGYCGRLDMAGWVFAGSRSRRRLAIIDIKRGVPAPSHQYQTVGYAELVDRAARFGGYKVAERWCIYLRPDDYQAKKHADPQDFLHFTGLLTTARLREKAGLINDRDETAFDDLMGKLAGEEWQEPQL